MNDSKHLSHQSSPWHELVLDFFPEGGTTKLVMVALARAADQDGIARVSLSTVMRVASTTARSAVNAIDRLVAMTWVNREAEGVYQINIDRLAKLERSWR